MDQLRQYRSLVKKYGEDKIAQQIEAAMKDMARKKYPRKFKREVSTSIHPPRKRLYSMKAVLRDFRNKPIIGYGVTGYRFIDAQYHRVLIETGTIGLFLFLFLFWRIGKVLLKLRAEYQSDSLYNILTTGTFCAFIGLIFHAIGTNTFIIVRIMEPLWCLLGLCMVIPLIRKKNNTVMIFTAQDVPFRSGDRFRPRKKKSRLHICIIPLSQ